MRPVKLLLLLIALSAIADTPTWQLANTFAEAYNTWASSRNVNKPLVLNVLEVQQWQKVKGAWRDFAKAVDAEYGK